MRDGLVPTVRAAADKAIADRLLELLAARPPGRVAFCWPLGSEFDVRPLVSRLLELGWTACLPVVDQRQAPMIFRPWAPGDTMATDCHGIPVPAAGQSCRPSVILLPLVAFDYQGYRLGYGGGYFDRTLAVLHPRPWTIGVGYEVGRVATIFPEPHDVPLDLIVTETAVHDPGQEHV